MNVKLLPISEVNALLYNVSYLLLSKPRHRLNIGVDVLINAEKITRPPLITVMWHRIHFFKSFQEKLMFLLYIE